MGFVAFSFDAALNLQPWRTADSACHHNVAALAAQSPGHHLLRQFGPIVLRTQMGCHQMLEAAVRNGAGDVGRRDV